MWIFLPLVPSRTGAFYAHRVAGLNADDADRLTAADAKSAARE
jgi:hypothetical protein